MRLRKYFGKGLSKSMITDVFVRIVFDKSALKLAPMGCVN